VIRALLHANFPFERRFAIPPGQTRNVCLRGAELVADTLDDQDVIDEALRGACGLLLYQPLYISIQAIPDIGPDEEFCRGALSSAPQFVQTPAH
jgi:hypothetical protein